jgi:hypothetical protein
MFGYAPTTRDESGMIRGQGITNSAQIMGEAKVGLVNDIGSALVGLAGMYAGSVDKKNALKGMDSAVGAMADAGALPDGFLNQYNQLDDATRPFIFQAIASPMFQAYQKKQGYQAYAEAMKGVYGNRAGTPGADSDFFDF